ncbi:hypothetical protein EV360DRAFT_66952 [Lentinula raphanica]|nr:hypothetical protein EV360DRAFT_66952 [Lentinula raphanica]
MPNNSSNMCLPEQLSTRSGRASHQQRQVQSDLSEQIEQLKIILQLLDDCFEHHRSRPVSQVTPNLERLQDLSEVIDVTRNVLKSCLECLEKVNVKVVSIHDELNQMRLLALVLKLRSAYSKDIADDSWMGRIIEGTASHVLGHIETAEGKGKMLQHIRTSAAACKAFKGWKITYLDHLSNIVTTLNLFQIIQESDNSVKKIMNLTKAGQTSRAAAARRSASAVATRATSRRSASAVATRAASLSASAEARHSTSHSPSLSTSPRPYSSARWDLREISDAYPSYIVVPDFEADTKTATEDLIGNDTSIRAVYFGLEFADCQVKLLDSKTVHTTVRSQKVIVRLIDFRSEFAFDFDVDKIYVTLVVLGYRRFVVAGTYDKHLVEENASLSSIGCTESYKGDLAVCFYGLTQQTHLLRGIPTLRDVDGGINQISVLKKVINAFVNNVKRHVEDGAPYKRVVRVH